jgi:hypothetical protein
MPTPYLAITAAIIACSRAFLNRQAVETSIFAFPSDLYGEGIDAVLDNVQERAGLGGIALAAVYHAGRDVFPHNPRRRVRYLENGVCYFRPDAERYRGLVLQPRVSRLVAEGDALALLMEAAGRRGLGVDAWTVYLHVDWVDEALAAACERNAFGDPMLTELCPANPDVVAYVRALSGDIASRGVRTIVAESLHYHPLEHGYHHERYFLHLGVRARFLLGLCFCEHCLALVSARGADGEWLRRFAADEIQRVFDGGPDEGEELSEEEARGLAGGELGALLDARGQAVAAIATAADAETAAEGAAFTFLDVSGAVKGYEDGKPTGGPAAEIAWRLGVDLEQVGDACAAFEAIAYAADPERVRLDLAAYRDRLPGGGRLSAAMRPMLPDCDSSENLAAKLRLAAELGVERVDLYHYGFAPLSVLDRIRDAVDATG